MFVVRLLFEFECAAVLHEFEELSRQLIAELFERKFDLLLFDCSVLLGLASAGKSLPREAA